MVAWPAASSSRCTRCEPSSVGWGGGRPEARARAPAPVPARTPMALSPRKVCDATRAVPPRILLLSDASRRFTKGRCCSKFSSGIRALACQRADWILLIFRSASLSVTGVTACDPRRFWSLRPICRSLCSRMRGCGLSGERFADHLDDLLEPPPLVGTVCLIPVAAKYTFSENYVIWHILRKSQEPTKAKASRDPRLVLAFLCGEFFLRPAGTPEQLGECLFPASDRTARQQCPARPVRAAGRERRSRRALMREDPDRPDTTDASAFCVPLQS